MNYELLFVNDGSRDGSDSLLDELAAEDPHVRVAHFTRNFGHQPAVTAGLANANGDVVAVMDCDLQDPPEVLPQFLDKWAEGFQVVYAVRRKRKEGAFKRLAYWGFYRLLNCISEIPIPADSGDFCVMDRSAVDLLNALPEKQRFVRGLRTWIGLKQTGLEYERSARAAGEPSYTFRALLKLAFDGFLSFSTVPLKLVTRAGVATILLAILLGLWVVGISLWRAVDPESWAAQTPRGWASLACLVLLLGSVQLLSLGIIGEYLARVFTEVKGRPTYLVARIEQQAAGGATGTGTGNAAANTDAAAEADARPDPALRAGATSSPRIRPSGAREVAAA